MTGEQGREQVGKLLERLEGDEAVVGIVGLGYVGLPLAVVMAEAGLRVIGFDVADGVVDALNDGRSHIEDVASGAVSELVDAGRFEATTDMSRLAECDAVSICVPTPLSKTRDPDVSFIVAAAESVARVLRPGQLVILESTTYPGTTREVLLPLLQSTGLRVGEDFFLCFSPERTDPGNREWQVRNTPKVMAGITRRCVEAGQAVYGQALERMIPVSSTEAAELTKLLENSFRAVNIALVNEMAQVSDRLGVDVWEVIEAAATKPFGFMKFMPGPGIGGHCIPLDPHYLAWKMKTLNYKTRLIELASEVNAEMPDFVVEKIQQALNRETKAVRGSDVLVLGVAYKPDVDDTRESPALDVMRMLEERGARVSYHDPYVPRVRLDGATWTTVELTDTAVADADCVAILTDHSGLDYDMVAERAKLVVDTRNALAHIPGQNIIRLSGSSNPSP